MSTEMNSTDYSALYRQERIRFLQSQINNHFLYTTLESMRGMMAMGKTDAVRSSLTQMATIYRYCSETAIQVPLSDEIRITELYHHLVSTMNPNEIALDIQIPEAVKTRMVPRMLIQPLVENALLHGFLHSGIREGTILVHAEEMNDQLYLKIENDGEGVDAETIMQLNTRRENTGRQIGFANVAERISLLYPRTGSAEILSDGLRGARVHVVFGTL